MKFSAVFALATAITGALAMPSAEAQTAANEIAKRDNDRTMELFRRTVSDESGELLKRQSAACWICLASCGFGEGWNCGCCAEGRACAKDCP
ncbi:hypothetical protein HII31_07612 [Pseudocercospora fuligena]|uniref:Uncharacterized protein n=1 Tax=Pseudocercospora fuligena TaxID=685502 RepID=A0A8H6VHV8_9PEZI|nr:hypothetical protein HII31_07612 [Pseudocercospora fuligena]